MICMQRYDVRLGRFSSRSRSYRKIALACLPLKIDFDVTILSISRHGSETAKLIDVTHGIDRQNGIYKISFTLICGAAVPVQLRSKHHDDGADASSTGCERWWISNSKPRHGPQTPLRDPVLSLVAVPS